MYQRVVVAIVCMGLLGIGAWVISASPGGLNIFHTMARASSDTGSEEGSCSKPSDTSISESAGFMIAGSNSLGKFDADRASVCQAACGTKQEYEVDSVVAQPGASEGDLTRCPVSGVVFAVASDRPAVPVGDDIYRMCCDGCAERFRAEPAQFVTL
jgi:hypothetical protein